MNANWCLAQPKFPKTTSIRSGGRGVWMMRNLSNITSYYLFIRRCTVCWSLTAIYYSIKSVNLYATYCKCSSVEYAALFVVEYAALLVVEYAAGLVVENAARLVVEHAAMLVVENAARLVVENAARLSC
jgi:hypothetical protein